MSPGIPQLEIAKAVAEKASGAGRLPIVEFTYFFTKGPLKKRIPGGITVRVGPVLVGATVVGTTTAILYALGALDDLTGFVRGKVGGKKKRPVGSKWYDYIPIVGLTELATGERL